MKTPLPHFPSQEPQSGDGNWDHTRPPCRVASGGEQRPPLASAQLDKAGGRSADTEHDQVKRRSMNRHRPLVVHVILRVWQNRSSIELNNLAVVGVRAPMYSRTEDFAVSYVA